MIRELQVHERSYCDCKKCSKLCVTQPGALAPCDIDHIAESFGVEPSREFLTNNFTSSMLGDSPAIRPKMIDGKCVFLGSGGHCTIHAVAPFECKTFSGCKPIRSALPHLEQVLSTNIDNQYLWVALRNHEETTSAT